MERKWEFTLVKRQVYLILGEMKGKRNRLSTYEGNRTMGWWGIM